MELFAQALPSIRAGIFSSIAQKTKSFNSHVNYAYLLCQKAIKAISVDFWVDPANTHT